MQGSVLLTVRPLARQFLVILIVLIPGLGAAQGFSSRDEFLAASDSALRVRLPSADPSVYPELRDLLNAQNTIVGRFYGYSASLHFAEGMGGTAFRGPAEIYINPRELLAIQDSTATITLSDVVTFILAHETAHMRQFRVFGPDSLRDPFKLRAIECDADVWAGMAMVSIAAGAGINPVEFGNRMRSASAVAFQIGDPAWEDETKHPAPMERALCFAVGTTAGMQYQLVRRYEATQNPVLLAQINEYRKQDPRWFARSDSIDIWTKEIAKAIVHYGGMRYEDADHKVDIMGTIVRTVNAINSGAAAVHMEQDSLQMPPPIACSVTDLPAGTEFRCLDPPAPSMAMGNMVFDNYVGMVEAATGPFGWVEGPEQPGETLRVRAFTRPDNRVGVIVMLNKTTRTVSLIYSAHR